MTRKNFAQILAEEKIDIKREYERVYELFYSESHEVEIEYNRIKCFTLYDLCDIFFNMLSFKGTCISLEDFNSTHDFNFEEFPREFDINYLLTFLEYVYNILINLKKHFPKTINSNLIMEQIYNVIEKIGYMEANDDKYNVTIFVPKSQPAIVVAETLPSDLSYKVIEYNHHSMKGDIARKQATLKLLADQLEAKRKILKGINSQLEDDTFYLINNLNIRHNNITPESNYYKEAIAKMSDEELEKWYDKTYELCLLSFMELENKEHKAQVLNLKKTLL